MIDYGFSAFHTNSELEKGEFAINVTNCGFFCTEYSPYIHKRFESDAMILYMHAGHATATIDKKKLFINQGDVYIFPPKQKYSIYYHNDIKNERYYIFFNGTILNEVLEKFNLTFSKYSVGPFPIFIETVDNIYQDFIEYKFENKIYRTSLLLNILAIISNITKKPIKQSENHRIAPAVQHMREHFMDKILSSEEYARMCFISKTSLNRYFKLCFNSTPTDYFYTLKINNAKIQLTNTNKTISEIAYELNFEDPLYFSRVFKKLTGYSPRDFRFINK